MALYINQFIIIIIIIIIRKLLRVFLRFSYKGMGVYTLLLSHIHKNVVSDCLKWLYKNKSGCLRSVGRSRSRSSCISIWWEAYECQPNPTTTYKSLNANYSASFSIRHTGATDPYLPQLLYTDEVVSAMKTSMNGRIITVLQVISYELNTHKKTVTVGQQGQQFPCPTDMSNNKIWCKNIVGLFRL